ncbi:MAG: hypothetical protein AAF548_00395 [Actinomycetota bacterium]
MLVIDCPHCGQRELVGTRRIRAIHNTDQGPVGDLRCPQGHALLYDFRRRRTTSVAHLLA